jgi:hypothetical protein
MEKLVVPLPHNNIVLSRQREWRDKIELLKSHSSSIQHQVKIIFITKL